MTAPSLAALAASLTTILERYGSPNDDEQDRDTLQDLAQYLADELTMPGVLKSTDDVAAVIARPLRDFGYLSDDNNDADAKAVEARLMADVWAAISGPTPPTTDSDSDPEDDEEVPNDNDDDELLEPGHCELCERGPMRLTFHHLIPRKTHRKLAARGIFTRAEMRTRGAMLCRQCHSMVHGTYDHETLATEYNTVEKLMTSEWIAAYARYQHKQPIRQRAVRSSAGTSGKVISPKTK
ncbi:hypothetical protein BC828DRAFT_385726 [Blastocladiella britannica]|nr:hypothetical protein BC828DRAFT_385726 [Blastocladiella britannica]